MRTIAATMGLALALLAASQAWAQDGQNADGDEFARKDADAFPNKKPADVQPVQLSLERKTYDKLVEKMFKDADANHDGMVTLDELHQVIAERKDKLIRDRFAQVDANHDQAISYAEFNQWQQGLGSVALGSDRVAGGGEVIVPEDIGPEPGRKSEEQLAAGLIMPINATMLAAANTNYDAGASLAEVLAYEDKKFDQYDANHDGWLVGPELNGKGKPGGK